VTPRYRCQSCGAAWVSYPKDEQLERASRCLRCDGAMLLDEPPPDGQAGPRAETDASPPLPNGLEDDAQT
jgi:DNA-directed RNA polymerase subunit RPC12/RpoP